MAGLLALQSGVGLALAALFATARDVLPRARLWQSAEAPLSPDPQQAHQRGPSLLAVLLLAHTAKALVAEGAACGGQGGRLAWLLGLGLSVVGLLAAVTGYLLALGNMGFWAAGVLAKCVTVLPGPLGGLLSAALVGHFAVSEARAASRLPAAHFLLALA